MGLLAAAESGVRLGRGQGRLLGVHHQPQVAVVQEGGSIPRFDHLPDLHRTADHLAPHPEGQGRLPARLDLAGKDEGDPVRAGGAPPSP